MIRLGELASFVVNTRRPTIKRTRYQSHKIKTLSSPSHPIHFDPFDTIQYFLEMSVVKFLERKEKTDSLGGPALQHIRLTIERTRKSSSEASRHGYWRQEKASIKIGGGTALGDSAPYCKGALHLPGDPKEGDIQDSDTLQLLLLPPDHLSLLIT